VSPRIKKALVISLGGIGVALVAIQLVPVRDVGSNPPERYQLDAPPEVTAVLRRACFDCHSNETRWPLYSRIAPGSWLMARDVHKGRKHFNFSEWGSVDEDERQTDRENCWEQIENGAMPPWQYLYPLHLSARLSPADKELLKSYLMKGADKDKKTAAGPSEPSH
jgi:heme-binding protein